MVIKQGSTLYFERPFHSLKTPQKNMEYSDSDFACIRSKSSTDYRGKQAQFCFFSL